MRLAAETVVGGALKDIACQWLGTQYLLIGLKGLLRD